MSNDLRTFLKSELEGLSHLYINQTLKFLSLREGKKRRKEKEVTDR